MSCILTNHDVDVHYMAKTMCSSDHHIHAFWDSQVVYLIFKMNKVNFAQQ